MHFFKALLFLSAGSIIHSVSDEQSFVKFGGLRHHLPFTYQMVLVGSLSLGGFPFLSGFYSKDFILEMFAVKNYTAFNLFANWLLIISALFTAVYSLRLIRLTFFSTNTNGI